MQSFFWHVLSDPRVHKLLAVEIRGAVAAGAVPAEGNLTWAQSQSLPYLQACLKEAMRVRPAVGLNITRVVPPEGVELAGEFFAGGTTVAVNGWVLHRDRETFGEDCEVFRPERWLEGEEKARVMERYMFQVSTLEKLVLRLSLFWVDRKLTVAVPVWRWGACLHRQEPRASGDQQSHPEAHPGL